MPGPAWPTPAAPALPQRVQTSLSWFPPCGLGTVTVAVRSGLCSGGSPLSTSIPVLVADTTTFLDRLPQDHHKAPVTRAFCGPLGAIRAARQRRRHPTSTEDSRSGSEHGNEHEADMFAVIKTGGKQYRVAAEDVITIDKVKGEPGEIIEFGEVLLLGGDSVQLGNPTVGGASVAGEVVDQGRGAKIIAFKK